MMEVIGICKKLRATADRLEEILAVEMLEYHNKNWLGHSENKRSIDRQNELRIAISDINELIRTIGPNTI